MRSAWANPVSDTSVSDTSKDAARAAAPRKGRLQQYAAELVARWPGRTARELADLDPRPDPRGVGRRLVECER